MRRPDGGSWFPYLVLGLALIPFLILAIIRWDQGIGFAAADWSQYLLHARALAEGRSYADIGYIFTPWNPSFAPSTQFPGLPAVLAGVFLVFDEPATVVTKAVMLSFTAWFVYLAGRYFARSEGLWIGFGVALLVGLSRPILEASTVVLSDIPFAAFVWLTLVVYDRDEEWRWGRVLLATLAGVGAMSMRPPGVVLIPCVVAYAALRRSGQRFRPLVPALIWLLAGAALLLVRGLPRGVSDPLSYGLHFNPEVVLDYRLAIAEALLYPFPWNAMNDLYHLISFAVAMVGIGVWLKTSYRSLLAIFTVAYSLVLINVRLFSPRYLWVLTPMIAFGLLKGLAMIGKWLRQRLRESPGLERTLPLYSVAGLAILAILFNPDYRSERQNFTDAPAVQDLFGELEALDSRQGIRVTFVRPRILAWETRIPAMPPFYADPAEVLEELEEKRITHVVVGDHGLRPLLDARLEDAVRAFPDRFDRVYSNAEFTVYRLNLNPAARGE